MSICVTLLVETVIFITNQGLGEGRRQYLVKSVWLGPCNGFGGFQGRLKDATWCWCAYLGPPGSTVGVRGITMKEAKG